MTATTSSRSPLRARLPDHAVIARAPARLDFAGGWTDVPPYCDELGGCVCNVAIDRYATVRVAHRSDPTFAALGRHERMPTLARAALARAALAGADVPTAVDVWSDFPHSAGLGGSSAVGVALAAALHVDVDSNGPSRTPTLDDDERVALAEWSRAVEVHDAGIAGGRQDHYAAAFGGALRLEFGDDASDTPVRVRRLALSDATCDALARRCIVLYTGESRISGDTITAVLGAFRDGEPRVTRALARMKAIAYECADALDAGDLDALGALLAEHWAHQRALHPTIPTARIDDAIARATAAGALGAKALGASGGGCVLAIARDGREDAVRDALAGLGELVRVAPTTRGVVVSAADPERAT